MRFIKILFFILCGIHLDAQVILEHLTKRDGLPSNQVYCAVQDKEGYMWIGTAAGAVRYDGKSLDVYTVDDGLTSNEVTGFYLDAKGRVWIMCFGGDICFYFRSKIYNKTNFRPLVNIPSTFFKYNSNVNGEDINYIDNTYEKCFNDTCKNYLLTLNLHTLKATSKLIRIYIHNKKYSTLDDLIKDFRTLYPSRNVSYHQFSKIDIHKDVISHFFFSNWGIVQLEDYNTYFINEHGESKKLRTDGVIKTASLSSGGAFYFIVGNRLYHYDFNRLSFIDLSFSPASIYLDDSESLWLPTSKGMYRIFNPFSADPPLVSPLKRPIYSIYSHQHNIFLGLDNNQVYNFFHNKWISKEPKLNSSNRILDFFHLNSKIYTIGDQASYEIKTQSELKKAVDGSNKNSFQVRDNEVLYSSFRSLSRLRLENEKIVDREIYHGRVFNVFQSLDSIIWIGTDDGLKYSRVGRDSFIRHSLKFENTDIVKHISQDVNGNMVFSTNNGIVVKKGNAYFHINSKHGLLDNQINKTITSQFGSTLYICTNKGLNIVNYTFSPQNKLLYSIATLTKSDGLPSEVVYTALEKDSSLFIGTEEGLFINSRIIFGIKDSIGIKLDKIYVNERHENNLSKSYEHTQNTLRFKFSAFYFKRNKEMQFSYQLTPIDQAPVISDNPSIIYRGLAPGDYTLKVFAFDKHYPKLRKSKVWTYRFTISPPYFKTWWFISLLTLLTASGVFLVYVSNMRRKQKQNLEMQTLLKQMALYRLEALKGQMNPHFIFNSLNTVQHFISNHNEREAMDFIAKFSSLIRKMLEHARRELIQLDKELIFLREYAEIEQIRYSHSFDVIFNQDLNGEEGEIEIPPMLIQPLIENAIKHGVSNLKERRGIVQVDFKILDDNLLYVSVRDNGMGGKPNPKSNSTKSMAVDIIRDRLSIYEVNGQYGQFSIDITDMGTTAVINIPIRS